MNQLPPNFAIAACVALLSCIACTGPEVGTVASLDAEVAEVGMLSDVGAFDGGHGDAGGFNEPHGIPLACAPEASGGEPWTGRGSLVAPRLVEVAVGEASPAVFGQVFQDPDTAQAGAPEGWDAELVVGPLGADPTAQGSCFRAVPVRFHRDASASDEYEARFIAERAGLFGMFYRYRPPGGAWKYGDLDGSANGIAPEQAAVLVVEERQSAAAIRVVTLNLGCRVGDWSARRDRLVNALAGFEPHVVGFQEDCADDAGVPQSYELSSRLAARLDRGFEVFRVPTHQARYPEGEFEEGIAMLTAFPIEQHFTVDLVSGTTPRRATVMDVRIGGDAQIRLVNTRLGDPGEDDALRAQAARQLVDQQDDLPIIITVGLNEAPGATAHAVLDAALEDSWTASGSSSEGFTFPADAPTARYDYIFAAGFEVDAAEVFGADGVGHRAVGAALRP